jgi:oxygen-independent coproporphyrinogen-3 oxidase
VRGPAHLSHYQLTLEPGTAFYYRPPALPDEELAFDMQRDCQQRLARAGFGQYEVSAYARPGRQCRHNLNYWRFGDYLGIGAGAHGKVTVDGCVIRTEKPRSPREYLQGGGSTGGLRRPVPASELPFEFMLNALRLQEGFEPAGFAGTTGLPAAAILPKLDELISRGLMVESGGRYRPTELGFRFLNDLQAGFLPEETSGSTGAELYTAAARSVPQRDFRHIVREVP